MIVGNGSVLIGNHLEEKRDLIDVLAYIVNVES